MFDNCLPMLQSRNNRVSIHLLLLWVLYPPNVMFGLWFYGGVAGSLSFFAWSAYATNVEKSLPAFKVEVTIHPILETI